MRFPAKGSPQTPAHPNRDFKFKDYSPLLFKAIRDRFHINNVDYLLSVCGNLNYLEFISNSKSGAFFFYSYDRKFMIKTISHDESKWLRSILPQYYNYVLNETDTLLTRFYGMHRVKPHKRPQVHFLIMASVFYTDNYISRVFDLKGSTHGRSATEKERKRGDGCVFKDNDLIQQNVTISIGKEKAEKLAQQMRRDTQFLQRLNFMDYSLLVGVHYREDETMLDEAFAEGTAEFQKQEQQVQSNHKASKTEQHDASAPEKSRVKFAENTKPESVQAVNNPPQPPSAIDSNSNFSSSNLTCLFRRFIYCHNSVHISW